jgi:hypothetical protein
MAMPHIWTPMTLGNHLGQAPAEDPRNLQLPFSAPGIHWTNGAWPFNFETPVSTCWMDLVCQRQLA